jgi:hypothetical protein
MIALIAPERWAIERHVIGVFGRVIESVELRLENAPERPGARPCALRLFVSPIVDVELHASRFRVRYARLTPASLHDGSENTLLARVDRASGARLTHDSPP